ncbi:MAG: ATP-dependent 6-phosphofructokinase, partial [Litorilinea sp.]
YRRRIGKSKISGTLLGTSRDKPHRMPVGGKLMDMTDVILANYAKHHLDALVCLGGGGTQKNALRLKKAGLNVVTLPKTIDNDVISTDVTFGFDTALGIATEAIDRLHSTAHSHHRIIVVEIMGHKAGWLALGAGISGGADVILIPEIPYDVTEVARAIRNRSRTGKQFSIVAVAEGAMSSEFAATMHAAEAELDAAKATIASLRADEPIAPNDGKTKSSKKLKAAKKAKRAAKERIAALEADHAGNTLRLAQQLEELTGLESRLTILGHLQRGGTPSAFDRLLASRLGTACAEYINRGVYGVMIAARGEGAESIPLEDVAGQRKVVPIDHPWIASARGVGTCMGDSA